MRKIGFFLATFLLCFASVGCREKTISDGVTTYGYAWWIIWGFVGLGVIMIPLGILVFRQKNGLGSILGGLALAVLGPIVCGMVAYRANFEYLKISDNFVEFPTGPPIAPVIKTINLNDVSSLQFEEEVSYNRKGKQINRSAVLYLKDGTKEELSVMIARGDALDEVIARLKKRGIPVQGNRGGL